MESFEIVLQELSTSLKNKGYRKNRSTWYKTKQNLTVVFSIEKSQYSKDTWYYWFGICLHDITDGCNRTITACQIKYRIDNVMNGVSVISENVLSLLMRWESMYGDIYSLRRYAMQGTLPQLTTLNAIKYLTSIGLSKN